jgi:hypothetical protein
MKGKICTNNEHAVISDLDNVDTSVEGKYGRIIVRCYRDEAGADRFDVLMEPKRDLGTEPNNEVTLGKEYIFICRGLLDFENVAKVMRG